MDDGTVDNLTHSTDPDPATFQVRPTGVVGAAYDYTVVTPRLDGKPAPKAGGKLV